jgi:hypothetical protein
VHVPRINAESGKIGYRRTRLAGIGKKKIETSFHNDLLSFLSLREKVGVRAVR